jgi:hypothetical protein
MDLPQHGEDFYFYGQALQKILRTAGYYNTTSTCKSIKRLWNLLEIMALIN